MNDYEWIGHHRGQVVADHQTAANVLGVSVDELSQYVKRGNIPAVDENPGRGRSREYTFEHMLFAAIVVELGKYGLRFSERNRNVIADIVSWTLDHHSGRVDADLIGKVVYFVIQFDDDGEILPLRPQADEHIVVKGLGASGLVVVITDILANLLGRLKGNSTASQAEGMAEMLGRLITLKPR